MPMKKQTLLRALAILAGHSHGCELRTFAKSMWPESKSWRKPTKMPNVSSPTGAVMNTPADTLHG